MSRQKQTTRPDVSQFDYSKMAAQSTNDAIYEKEKLHFASYQEVVQSLMNNEKYDYEMWLASATFEEVMVRQNGKQVKAIKLVGVRLNGNKPIQLTRMTKIQADEINKHVSIDGHTSKYLFLAKEVVKVKESEAVNV